MAKMRCARVGCACGQLFGVPPRNRPHHETGVDGLIGYLQVSPEDSDGDSADEDDEEDDTDFDDDEGTPSVLLPCVVCPSRSPIESTSRGHLQKSR